VQIVSVPYPQEKSSFTPRPTRSITDFIVHHTAGPVTQTPLDIDKFERTRGMIYMPYTWIIAHDGTIYRGRPPLVVSAATYGRNAESVACCLIGNFQQGDAGYTGPPADQQVQALTALCIWAHQQYPSITRTYSHSDVASLFYHSDSNYATACCGSDLRKLIPAVRLAVSKAMNH
jgi:hypothetical protein